MDSVLPCPSPRNRRRARSARPRRLAGRTGLRARAGGGRARLTARLVALLGVLALAATVWGTALAAGQVRPPEQPSRGPGGSDYLYGRVEASRHGEGAQAFWLFEPDAPRPRSAPLVLFLHGWRNVDPRTYGAWIEHLVRKGAVVVYPRYQESLTSSPSAMMDAAAAATEAALQELARPGHVRPDLDRVVFVGHSLGAVMAANLAAEAQAGDLPRPAAMALLNPADVSPWPGLDLPGKLMRASYEAIPASTRLLLVVGDQDILAGERYARALWERLAQIPDDRRNAVRLVSDDYGTPRLSANHTAPQAPGGRWAQTQEEPDTLLSDVLEGSVDALDHHGYWKLVDALMACTFEARWCEYVLGNDEAVRSMGRWSDGRRVNEAAIVRW
ncbi:alpha/beta hydrolase fold domain-containing protein [Limnochorda pilosa]|uniref:Uncharacterized protein n=1 Tax=Limnochorda pilosa TaxID=1555112 RepID=A0A0K2SMA7_LIMPI|nr:alpha/beta hydrolase fold domain-containing protein [Limnochorda pilosa]BAS28253.1 hypothetical protein LIP_2412 [Limnochorda pilosa]